MSIDNVIAGIARAEHTTKDALVRGALGALLREKRRAVKNDRLDILRRYGVVSPEVLDEKISNGELSESPAWEERIALDALGEALERIERDLAAL